jgi:UDP-N-acetylglucosamine/UDP-N-acetylgalactosamine diphosphorylase
LIICFFVNRTFAVWEVRREDEFSPLKNGAGNKDTPETCRRDLIFQHIRYVKQAGGLLEYGFILKELIKYKLRVFRETEENICEISPLVSYSGEVKNFEIFILNKYSCFYRILNLLKDKH